MKLTEHLGAVLLILVVSPVALHGIFTVVPGVNSYVVASQSMAPAISAGSLIYVADTGDYHVGDIVTFQRDEKLVTHRIIENESNRYVTKGDANDGPDAPITANQVVGEVVLAIPLYGYFFDFASSPIGYGLLVVVPAFLLIWIELRK